MTTAAKWTKEDLAAATRLQIWQEIMRHQPPYDPRYLGVELDRKHLK